MELQRYDVEPISLDVHVPGLTEDGESLRDIVYDPTDPKPFDRISFTLLQEQLHSVLDTLSEREAGIVAMRCGFGDGVPMTLDAIGSIYGVTRERIRQIEKKTMAKLAHPSRSQVLYDYYDGHPPFPSSIKSSGIVAISPAPERPAIIPEDFEIGESIKVLEGPFETLPAVVLEIKPESQQIVVVVTIFERETPVLLSFGQVSKLQ